VGEGEGEMEWFDVEEDEAVGSEVDEDEEDALRRSFLSFFSFFLLSLLDFR